MKRLAMIFVLCSSVIAGPAIADHGGRNLLSRENIGGAIGAALGGLAGNKIVKGDGQPAATAAGAVGGFLLGKNIAHNYGSDTYRGSGHAVGYQQPGGYVESSGYTRTTGYDNRTCCGDGEDHRHGIRPIHATFVARCTSNVRAGPSTRYHIVGQLQEYERVRVVGKVRGRNWYQVRSGHRTGYVYAPLLRPTGYGGYEQRAGWRH